VIYREKIIKVPRGDLLKNEAEEVKVLRYLNIEVLAIFIFKVCGESHQVLNGLIQVLRDIERQAMLNEYFPHPLRLSLTYLSYICIPFSEFGRVSCRHFLATSYDLKCLILIIIKS
jgi:hypothetical protein